MTALVSVIMPCFNAGRWIREAIESCLAQSHGEVEVIVIDDGSTDESLSVLQQYSGLVRWETGPHRGGNHARNRGLRLARGEYVQYLDADDMLLADKLADQIRWLRETAADVVYGDLRVQTHLPDRTIRVEHGGAFRDGRVPALDVVEALLEHGPTCPAAFLFRRAAILSAGDWDEELRCGQDRAFLLNVALSGARFAYAAGECAVYRRWGACTVSTQDPRTLVANHARVLSRAVSAFAAVGSLPGRYATAVARWCRAMRAAHAEKLDEQAHATLAALEHGLHEGTRMSSDPEWVNAA